MLISLGQKAIICLNHPRYPKKVKVNGHYREYFMQEGKVIEPNKLDKTKEVITEYLTCPRCSQTVLITPDIRQELDKLKQHGRAKTRTSKRPTHTSVTGTTPATV